MNRVVILAVVASVLIESQVVCSVPNGDPILIGKLLIEASVHYMSCQDLSSFSIATASVCIRM